MNNLSMFLASSLRVSLLSNLFILSISTIYDSNIVMIMLQNEFCECGVLSRWPLAIFIMHR